VIFISHKLNEAMEIADHITVLRLGRVVGTTTPAQTSREELASMMVGRTVMLTVEKEPAKAGDVVLDVSGLVVLDDRKLEAVKGVNFQVRAGEVLGVAGVQGNGQTELVEALTGLRPIQQGQIGFLGQAVINLSPRKIREIGSAHVPEDRQRDGLVLPFSVADNLVLNTYYEAPFTRGMNLQQIEIEKAATERVELFDIRTPNVMVPVSNLSGGNQQKVIVAREFSRPIKLLIASQPTRGLDVGSIEYIHRRIIQKRDEGCAVLMVSTELDEILTLSDRIAVMFAGKIIAVLNADEATRERLGLLMAGVQESVPAEIPS